MRSLNDLKNKGQESWNWLVETGQQQPEPVKLWGATAAAAVAGGVALSAVAKGVVGVIAALAVPPVVLTVGAVAGGLVGWSFMHKDKPAPAAPAEPVGDSDAVIADAAMV